MDLDEIKFGGVGLLLAVTGTVGLALGFQAAATGVAIASAVALPSVGLLAVGRALDPARRWSIAAGRSSCALAAVLWLTVAVAIDAPEVAAYSLTMVGACRLGWSMLDRELRGPDWARPPAVAHAPPVTVGWIEDLSEADAALPR